jgi:tetratricopeptide (TPR) repeat protein
MEIILKIILYFRFLGYITSIFDLTALQDIDRRYLLYFSILPSVEIHLDYLKIFFAIKNEEENDFINSINRLIANGWLNEKDNYFKTHPLIQTVIREKMKPDAENCKDLIISFSYLFNYNSYENPLSRKEFVPFAESILCFLNEDNKDLSILIAWLSEILREIGNYNKALEYQKRVINFYEKDLILEEPELANSYNNIALTYCNLGNYKLALEFNKKSISIREKVLVPEHPDLATSYNNIAVTYHFLSNYEQALDYQKKSISIRKKVLVPEHPDLATSYNNIAEIYSSLGNYKKALEFHKKVLIIDEKSLEKNHPFRATSYNNIAGTYRNLGNYKKALEFQMKDIAIREKVLVPKHPDLATSYWSLALTYYYIKDYNKAKYYIIQAVEIYKKALPENHPYINDSLEWQKIINEALKENK